MKKLFISCPMRGLTDKEIEAARKKMKKIAEAVFDCKLTVINSYKRIPVPEEFEKNGSVYCLGEAIKCMAEADYYIGIRWPDDFRGCRVENMVSNMYGIQSYDVEGEIIFGREKWFDMTRVMSVPECSDAAVPTNG